MKQSLRAITCVGTAIVCFPIASALAQAGVTRFDQLVPLQRQKALGLDALTTAQKAAIRDLMLEAYRLGLRKGADASPPGAVSPVTPAGVVESRIDGSSNGWEGETIVKLANGQIWQQTEYYYQYRYSYGANVIIYPSGEGFRMRIEGIEKSVAVRRIR